MKYILLRKVIKRVVFANVISYKIRVILMAIHCFLQKKKKKILLRYLCRGIISFENNVMYKVKYIVYHCV